MLKISTFITVLVIAGTVASTAEAHRMSAFYNSSFYRNQGRQPAQPCHNDKRRNLEEAFARARERRLAELRAERAQAAALAAKRARLAAIAQKKAAAAKQAAKTAAVQTTSGNATNVAKKSDQLAVSTASNATATPTQTAAAAPQTCRRYSAASDAVIEIPCQ